MYIQNRKYDREYYAFQENGESIKRLTVKYFVIILFIILSDYKSHAGMSNKILYYLERWEYFVNVKIPEKFADKIWLCLL